ncbi:uncharacterized protein LY89DRAFT_644138 [Mollisia scopiformis]|uniref:DUF1279 domain-containing protein n=1 Tax=Mollisia scopiformis TaxID=149040 RepID=A0A194XDE8_MOLSC|nr:uncharacterized protein LY89DRAFT_644138 [Mollisia scopiformis]KUJ18179.1 hypothetical protein LY89DRAFT_644138 [Mollisia scopiformis]
MLRTTISAAAPRSASRLPSTIRSSTRPFYSPIRTPLRSAPRRTFSTPPASKSSTSFTFSSHGRPTLHNSTILRQFQQSFRNFHKTRPRLNGAAPASEEPTTLGGRLKKLSREYGWSAVGVYFALSALDFPFCYLLVNSLGTEKIGEWEEFIVSNVKRFIPEPVKQTWNDWRGSMRKAEHAITGEEDVNEHIDKVNEQVKAAEVPSNATIASPQTSETTSDGDKTSGSDVWGVEKAREEHKRDASLATQLAIAYAIHKSFIFVRVPLAAAVTPKVVQTLRGWGWDIGKRTTKEAKAIKRASMPVKPKARWAGKPKTK